MLLFATALLVVLFIMYQLLVKGWLWKLILFVFGWFGLYIGLRIYVDGAMHTAVTINGYGFSWAAVVPTLVCICALACTKDD